ncbi:unnamed protein product, partial [Hymenolepis diminuta]
NLSTVSRFLLWFITFSSLCTEIKALSTKFEGSKYVDTSITPMFFVPSTYSIRHSASVGILDPPAAEDGTTHVLEFIRDLISGKFFESWFNKHYRRTVQVSIFTSGFQTKPWLPIKIRPLKLMEESPNVKLQELVRGGVKMASLTPDSALIDFDAISASIPQSGQFAAQSNPSAGRNMPSSCPCCRG